MIQIDNPIHRYIALIIDSIGRVIYHIGRFCGLWNITKNDLTKINPQKILVIEEEPIGDGIMATAIFPSLRKRYPNAHIAVMVGSWTKNILLHNPYIDETIVHDCPWAFSNLIIGRRGITEHVKYFLSYPKILGKLRKKNYDLAIDLRGDFRNIFFFIFLGGVKYSLSFNRTGGDYLLTQSVPFRRWEHEVKKNFTLLKYLGINETEKRIEIYPSPEDYQKVTNLLGCYGIDKKKFICVIHPGTRRRVRLWPLKRYAEVADFIQAKYDTKIILTGSKEDRNLTKKICECAKDEIVDLSGELTLLELAALLKRTNLLICPDTSIMHLASAFSTPTIALFGPGDPQQTGPFQGEFYVIDKHFSCRPCLQRECKLKRSGYSTCMEAIKVNEVESAIEELLNKTGVK